jgi:hypothetical protein
VATRAPVVAEVADVGGRVVVGSSACAAILRIGGVGEAVACDGGVVDPEPERLRSPTSDVGEEGVVGVHDRPGGGIEVGDCCPPALGDVLKLPVAVELVAEEVAEADGLRPDAGRNVGERALVDLEEAEIRLVRCQERGRDAGDEVRARSVVGESHPVNDDLRDHGGGGRLPVRRRDERGAERQAACELPNRGRVDRGEDLPRNGRSSALAGEPGQPS